LFGRFADVLELMILPDLKSIEEEDEELASSSSSSSDESETNGPLLGLNILS
jgi:hypothetical protein